MARLLMAFLICSALMVKAQPQMKEGLEAFVRSNTIYPPYSLHNCIQGSVNISFKLNQKGEVYHSEVRSGLGIDLDDEALRLIRLTSGKWTVPNDYDTAAAIVVPVNFHLSGYGCENKSEADIQEAISRYQADQGLTNAVLNFYRNKEQGKSSEAEEAKIVSLKRELGYDDAYFQEKINQGKAKLKQKDRQGACEDFQFVKYMGSDMADELLKKHCN